jgi:hypothetical protein
MLRGRCAEVVSRGATLARYTEAQHSYGALRSGSGGTCTKRNTQRRDRVALRCSDGEQWTKGT